MTETVSTRVRNPDVEEKYSVKGKTEKMIIPRLDEAKRALTLYHLANTLLTLSFVFAKGVPEVCQRLFFYEGQCEIDSREREILIFLAVITMWRGRKATHWMHYVNKIFLFSKLANSFLFLRADPLIGIVFIVLCIIVTVVFPEPIYAGPENITYYQGAELFDALASQRNAVFVVMFYTTWSPDCKHVTPIFAKLSDRFSLPNLKFGKLDVSRWPKEADRFCVNAHPTSRQLPTVCVFRDAKEMKRRPLVSEKRRAIPFVFTEENCILEFDLLNLYKECTENLSSKDRKAMDAVKKTQ